MSIAILSTKPVRLARAYRHWADGHYQAYLHLRHVDPAMAEWHKRCSGKCYDRADEKFSSEELAKYEALT
jgi:hypothetical protein